MALAFMAWAVPAQAGRGYCDDFNRFVCSDLGQSTCETRDGCYWVPPNGSGNPGCGGTPTACSSFGSLSACIAEYGCTWKVEPVCGDGQLDSGEQCDDGNLSPYDGCDDACRFECGNGTVEPNEQCDDGNRSSYDGCDSSCRVELCGNGAMDPGEACDDGNYRSGDGCSRDCKVEPGSIQQMSAAPRRLEWQVNSRVAMTPGVKSVQITYPKNDHALTIRPGDIQIVGADRQHFQATYSASLPFQLTSRNPLRVDVAYVGPTGSNFVAEAALKVDGRFYTVSRSAQVSLRAEIFNPEVEAFPELVAIHHDAPCGGFGPTDAWESPAKVGIIINSYPATQRIHSITEANATFGTILAKPADPSLSFPVDIAPGDALVVDIKWSGEGHTPDAEGELDIMAEDVASGGTYYVSQRVLYRSVEDCTTPRFESANAFNFGVSEVGITSTWQLPYFNMGTADLEIFSIEDCDQPADHAAFGHQANLPIMLPPTGYSGGQTLPFEVVPDEPGYHRSCKRIYTNDEVGEYEVQMLTVTADREVQMVPPLLDLTPTSPMKTAMILNVGALPIVIRQGALETDPAFRFTLPPGVTYPVTVPAGDFLELQVTVVDLEHDASGELDLDTDPQDGLPVVGDSIGLRYDAP